MTQKSLITWTKAIACGCVSARIVFGAWIPSDPSVAELVDVMIVVFLLTLLYTPPSS